MESAYIYSHIITCTISDDDDGLDRDCAAKLDRRMLTISRLILNVLSVSSEFVTYMISLS